MRIDKRMIFAGLLSLLLLASVAGAGAEGRNALVFQSDFGLKDGAVSAMKGVSFGVDTNLAMFDLTHEIPAYNIWEGAYRLLQTAPYWPRGTVFVSVVDPGVGSERKSVVAKTRSGIYIVTPDNGTLTLIADSLGLEAVRIIDENLNRLPGSSESYTFFGRDVYAYTGARLASGRISFEEVGPLYTGDIVRIPYRAASMQGSVVSGTIPILDIQYGNVWTNIGKDIIEKAGIKLGDTLRLRIFNGTTLVYGGELPYVTTFSDVPEGKPLSFLNSLLELSFAINMDSFAATYKVASGAEWSVEVIKANP